ncbi:LptF/LptG family permease [Moheibacter sediminis]|uniref:Lipopolysaccharide export system permease protein n=1 Tax=Moheibacter sediminis TaxID=1434700 RepID=A0A1W1ZUE8_9FLAO|nr:LptF/LptG family permease [Moheibacter sediminis]SMC51708.1 lipopolysaccharide export system permease protein [Moheibacter sediminis]
MIKKLDWYTVKTFLGPFFFIFSILFFIFIVQFAWQEMEKFAGKGLSWLTIGELLIYLGINVIQLVLPLTILLGSIMTFGGLGERYELAAMKASGISLARILTPLFTVVSLMAIGLYFFGDHVMPYSQRKAKNLAYNIVKANPTLQLVEGAFIENIPGFSMKINKVSGENQDILADVFIHKTGKFDDDKQTIISKKGTLTRDKEDIRLLKMELFDGHIYVDEIKGKGAQERKNQPNQSIKFDTMNLYIDISEILQKAMDEENITDHYRFLNASKLNRRIDSMTKDYAKYYDQVFKGNYAKNVYGWDKLKEIKLSAKDSLPKKIEDLKPEKKTQLLNESIASVEREMESYKWQGEEIRTKTKIQAKQKLHYHRNFSYAFTCIIFFLIGAPLGAIVKKGGIGMPVVISIVIFVLYYIINFSSENMTKNGIIDPTFAAWSANLIFFPFAMVLFYKANNDSGLFNLGNYLDPVVKFFSRFRRKQKNTEHSRYQ